ncbi:MAG: hypothetical protein QW356_05445 [Candidatus Hadarchaeales archaeon]
MSEVRVIQITPEEARRKLISLQWSLFRGQYEVRWVIQDLRPEQLLRNELAAFWEGRIERVHGWWKLCDAYDWIVDKVGEVVRDIVDFACRVGGFIWGAIRDAVEDLLDLITRAGGWLWNRLSNLVSSVIQGLGAVGGFLWQTFRAALRDIWDLLGSVWNKLVDLGSWIWDKFVWLKDTIASGLSTVWEGMKGWIGRIMGEIIDAFRGFFSWLGDVFAKIGEAIFGALKWVWDKVLVPAGRTIGEAIHGFLKRIADIVSGVFTAVLKFVSAGSPATPEVAQARAESAMRAVFDALVGLGAMTLIGEALHPLKQMGLPHLSAMLYHTCRFEIITGDIVGPLSDAAIRAPLVYYYNYMFTPRIPRAEDIVAGYLEGVYPEEQARELLKSHGYSPVYWLLFQEVYDGAISPFFLVRLAEAGLYDRDLYEKCWRDHRISPAYRPLLHQYFQLVSQGEIKGVATSVALSRYEMGLTGDMDLEQELAGLGVPEALRARWIQAARLRRDTRVKEEELKELWEDLRSGSIGLSEFQRRLSRLVTDPSLASIYLTRAARVMPKPVASTKEEEVRAYGYGVVVRRIREGLVTETEARQELALLGYTPAQAERIITMARLEADLDVTLSQIQATREAFRAGLIEEPQAIEQLTRVGLPEERARLYVERDRIHRKVPKEKKPEEEVRAYGSGVVITRVREGYISPEAAREELKMLGYTPAQIDRLVTLALLERDTYYCRERVEAARLAYRAGVLTEQDLREELLAVPLDPGRVEMIVAEEYYRKLPKVKRVKAG